MIDIFSRMKLQFLFLLSMYVVKLIFHLKNKRISLYNLTEDLLNIL